MPYKSRRWRTLLVGTAAALTFAPLCLTAPPERAEAASSPTPDKIDKALLADLGKGRKTSFLVSLKGSADLAAARSATTKADKATRVYQAKSTHAATAQASLRSLLTARKADFTPLWAVNAAKVTGDAALAAEIAKLPEVERVVPDLVIDVAPPQPAKPQAEVNGVGWNLDRIGAPKVWSESGTRGEGIVVGNVGSGVQFSHPALAAQYRGSKADGTVDNNYNWYDATGACAATNPCDTQDYGTMSTGAAVGGVAADEIGVAPSAKWIAARGCTTRCMASTLLLAGQWMLAPTDLSGRNPRPDLAPDIIVNTWGFPRSFIDPGFNGYHRWYKEIVDAWVAAGIFPALDNGLLWLSGRCNDAYSPGQYVNGYSAGVFDVNNAIAGFSGRGPGENGEVKPNIAAPGVDIRVATRRGGYRQWSASWLGAAHVAGSVALLWSAVPSLYRDIPATRALLDRTALDVDDTTCGGTATKNNVWGEGRLDTHALVRAAPAEQIGGLRGTVTEPGGSPIAQATVTVAAPGSRTVVTAADGTFEIPRLTTGSRRVTVKKLGYGEATVTAEVTAGQTAVSPIELTAVTTRAVSGRVTVDGTPVKDTTVSVAGLTASTATDAEGRYRLPMADGTFELKVTPPRTGCAGKTTVPITVSADLVKDIALPRRMDDFGYACVTGAEPYIEGTERYDFPLSSFPEAARPPFPFPFYDRTFTRIWPSQHGFIGLDSPSGGFIGPPPNSDSIGYGIYPFGTNLFHDAQSGVYTRTIGTAPNRAFVIEWRNVAIYEDQSKRVSVSTVLGEDGSISFRYRGVSDALTAGGNASIGLEGAADNAMGFSYSYRTPVLTEGHSVTFTNLRHGQVSGRVTDANDGKPLAGAAVKIGDVATTVTSADGAFSGFVPPGDYPVTVSKEHYGTFTRQVTAAIGARATADFPLVTGKVSASVDQIDLVMPADTTKTGTITLTNLGGATAYTVRTDPVQGWLSVTPSSGELAPGQSVTVTVTGGSAGVRPGSFRTGTVTVRSVSGARPQIDVPITVAVPRHQVAVDVGGTADVTDGSGERWSADRAYTPGGWGYMGTRTRTHTATRAIGGTSEQTLFKTARESMLEYRFDQVPNGVYTVELGFAETRNTRPGQRVFDVMAEGQLAVPLLDLAGDVGAYTATTRVYTVKVTDGQLNLRFVGQRGNTLVNAIRISERPDKTIP
ncbi:carboxypeptidase regulatory-like domain-containing protein [Sinosporangium siamense]|uniref:alpha-amylase n=1 Tax=Sinosporangium siamense TaxID=1367973 RepID=A0A919RJL7_9ACTN|nr:carboxypeptidase regulatory-like domain-containing protein [Sinosporangium siamense]GII95046.1 hypothetical protein Ssi02_52770 [Sinosporangium siamense]